MRHNSSVAARGVRKRTSRGSAAFAVLLLFVIGGVFFGGSVERYRMHLRQRTWAQTDGVAISATQVRTYKSRFGCRVRYAYQVDGVDYIGTRLNMNINRCEDQEEIDRTIQMFAPGSLITLFYDPGDPSASIVDYSLDPGVYGAGIAGLASVLVGTAWIAIWVRRRMRGRSQWA